MSTTTFLWLIEAGPVSAPVYVNFHEGLPAWTFDANDACRFHTKEAAESALGLLSDPSGCRVTEHGFDATEKTQGSHDDETKRQWRDFYDGQT